MKQNIFAYTGPTGQGYPPYVSINLLENGDVEVTVRGDPVFVDPQTDMMPPHYREGPTVSAVVRLSA